MKLRVKNYKLYCIKNILKKNFIFICFSDQRLFNRKICKLNNFISMQTNTFLFKTLLNKSIYKLINNALLGPVTLFYSRLFNNKTVKLTVLPFFNNSSLVFFLLSNKLYLFCQIKNLTDFKFLNQILKFRNFLKLILKDLSVINFRNNVI